MNLLKRPENFQTFHRPSLGVVYQYNVCFFIIKKNVIVFNIAKIT